MMVVYYLKKILKLVIYSYMIPFDNKLDFLNNHLFLFYLSFALK
jgi:hypothetical protein